ncbi:oligopeptidase B [Algoriphagus ratkowskyi]|uniref:Proline-specific endopeptidase n=1 Tax=Algoriphagus ratkowskyi TaxID=57028 RepID=A0A2W7SNV9_9BACT|nr:S9 family peptidase [Algoriphagus ratkowskyi]PZX52432.1 oligopeptidase B [Algoriphagus ratkowskyi]TXD76219.1 S9 family peptidase [Algoriphagus ratkowskyi]
MQAPQAKQIPQLLETHGHQRTDNYYWMRDRDNPEVIAYLNAENEYLKTSLKTTEDFQENLFQEMKGRIKEDDESVPYFKSGYFWYVKYETGGEYPLYCRKKGSLEADEEVFLDVNLLAEGKSYYQVGGTAATSDLKTLAFAADEVGRRIYAIHFKNLETGEILSDYIPEITGNYAWAEDNQTLFYTKQNPDTLRSHQVYSHKLGTTVAEDVLIYTEKDEEFSCVVHKTKSEKFILIHSESTISSEMRFLDASNPTGLFTVLQERIPHLEYAADHYEDYFWIRTNLKAQNFKLVKAPISNPQLENWEDVIPHRDTVLLEDFDIFSDFLVVQERSNGLCKINIKPWDGTEGHSLEFDDETYTAWISTNPEFNTAILRFGYNSLVTPASTFDYNMVTKEKTLLKQQEIVGGYDATAYTSARIWATAADGKMIPISLVYKIDTFSPDGSNPLLLYAYGSYGYSMDAYFSSSRLSLLDRGFVFAIAHIRGGEDLGRGWYEDGKMLKKRNTFTDYIHCAEHLIDEKYTSSDHLYAMGGSAGGLLMGAVMNLRPDLFNGLIAAVPFVDVVTTMLDESIPLTTGEFQEWGNPKDKEFYEYMLSYSPYDNVEAKDYPNLLITSGLHDSQVQYWEPTKWVAKLRELKTDSNLLFLHTNMDAGHGGASGRFNSLKEMALEYTFLFYLEKLI